MTTKLTIALLAALTAPLAHAEESIPSVSEPSPPHKKDRGEFMLAIKGGGLFSEAFSNLGPSYLVDLEVGYALPVLKHRLAFTIEAAFTDPQTDGKQSDARLDASGGAYSWHLEQRELMLGLTFMYRHPIGRLVPYVGVGPRLFLLESRVTGQAGAAPVLLSSEQSTKVGVGIPVGLGFTVGPGHIFLEAGLLIGNIDHTTTGNVSVGVSSITVAAGYRFML